MMLRATALLVTLALAVTGCEGDGDALAPPSSSPTPSAAASPSRATPSATASPSPLAAACDDAEVHTVVAAALAAAGLAPVGVWSEDVAGARFTDRTVSGADYAQRLGFDCGLLAAARVGVEERLLVAAWTGPRMAFVVQTTEQPAGPAGPTATVDLLVGAPDGAYLDAAQTRWVGTTSNDVTFVVGHVDFSLGAAAKSWLLGDAPPDDGPSDGLLASERHGISVLEAAGMREVDLAEPAQIGSEEGHVQFVSPTGQVSVADVAPTGWFDPSVARYYDGPTRFEVVDGADVRVTEPGPDAPSYAIAAELGFACGEFVWLLQPPLNGTVDELLTSAAAILKADGCR